MLLHATSATGPSPPPQGPSPPPQSVPLTPRERVSADQPACWSRRRGLLSSTSAAPPARITTRYRPVAAITNEAGGVKELSQAQLAALQRSAIRVSSPYCTRHFLTCEQSRFYRVEEIAPCTPAQAQYTCDCMYGSAVDVAKRSTLRCHHTPQTSCDCHQPHVVRPATTHQPAVTTARGCQTRECGDGSTLQWQCSLRLSADDIRPSTHSSLVAPSHHRHRPALSDWGAGHYDARTRMPPWREERRRVDSRAWPDGFVESGEVHFDPYAYDGRSRYADEEVADARGHEIHSGGSWHQESWPEGWGQEQGWHEGWHEGWGPEQGWQEDWIHPRVARLEPHAFGHPRSCTLDATPDFCPPRITGKLLAREDRRRRSTRRRHISV